MKKILALALCLALLASLAACSTGNSGTDADSGGSPDAGSAGLTLETVKVGFVHIGDASDMGYTYNHDKGTKKMAETLGLKDAQIVNKYNISEDKACDTAVRELVEAGCNIIFATSFGFEDYMLEVAKDFPDVVFCHATGYKAADSGLANFHNYFGDIFEARYLSGIAAGLKTQTNKLGYVAAMPYAECISGYDAFFLGARSVNPNVTMEVVYTNDWNNPTAEAQAAQALIGRGCDVLGQHVDSTAVLTTAESNGVWGVGYNSDMIGAAPNAALTSAIWDWSIYLTYAVNQLVKGEKIPADWSGGYADGVCALSALNDAIVADGTKEAVEAAEALLLAGSLQVFAGPLTDNTGATVVEAGAVFVEPKSAPSFDHVLEGISAA
jgi:basic membrane protein A